MCKAELLQLFKRQQTLSAENQKAVASPYGKVGNFAFAYALA